MARRTVAELIQMVKDLIGDKEGVENLLEDLTDSVGDVDLKNYVSVAEYNTAVAERDKYKGDYDSMRSRYINRFYGGYDKENDRGYIMSQAPEAELIKDEEVDYYKQLFE